MAIFFTGRRGRNPITTKKTVWLPRFARLLALLVLSPAIGTMAFAFSVLSEGDVCQVGDTRQLFVDTWLIDSMQGGVDLKMHSPVDAGDVFAFGAAPWESSYAGYGTVIYDEGLYRLYYRSYHGLTNGAYSYAESSNGINWTRPVLNLHEFDGSLENNIIIKGDGGHSFSPFLDINPAALPAERFKALGLRRTEDGSAWLVMAFDSPDGINWNLMQDEPVMTGEAYDSQNVAFWSEREGCYVAYYRTKSGGHTGLREVSRATSSDFRNWTMEGKVDQIDGNGECVVEEIYINQTAPYYRADQIYVATAARIVFGRNALQEGDDVGGEKYELKYTATSDAVLMTTRGGLVYDREFMESWIRPGLGIENWSNRSNYPALGIVPTGENEMSVYLFREYGMPSCGMRRYSMRLDGFASVHAGYEQGELLTKPMVYDGNSLRINYSTSSAGFIKIEIQDEDGNAIEGFSLDDCPEIFGDRISGLVTWASGHSPSELSGTTVRLRIVMKDADLYSFKFVQ